MPIARPESAASVGSEFGGWQELYELNYSGPHENNPLETLRWQRADGDTDRYEDLVERFLAEVRHHRSA